MQKVMRNEITAADTRLLAQTFLSAVNRFYDDPKNVMKFEEWKQQRKQAETTHETQEVT